MSDEETIDIVGVSAHPDDTEIGVGGTLAKFAKMSGLTTGIIDLTTAEPTPLNSKYRSPDDFDPDYAEVRLEESRKAAEILDIKRRTLNLPNRRLFDDFKSRCALATVFREWKPKVVITIYGRTVMASPDHYQAQLLAEASVFYSRLTKWEKYFNNLPVHKIKNLLYFPVRAVSTGLHPENYTSFFVDITEEINQKRKALEAYESQFQSQGHGKFIEMIIENNRALGSRIGVKYAEHLASPSPLKIDDFSMFM
ncbi:MAG: Diacetylchitobiose deacetylase [Candidatus Heimdallarchaeota archaeon LC_3]|nr:MAG: Diacetylchitobiose deacetylase [Candidatus Heimdallarchaeota archaeon LC_3]